VEILKQAQNSPVPVEKQVAIIYLGTKGKLNKVPVNRIKEFETEFLDFMEAKHSNILDLLRRGQLTDEVTSTLERVGAELASKY